MSHSSKEWASVENSLDGGEPLLDGVLKYAVGFVGDQRVLDIKVFLNDEEVSSIRPSHSGWVGTWTGLMWSGGSLSRLTGRCPLATYRKVMASRRKKLLGTAN
jgi:hypothetical protein